MSDLVERLREMAGPSLGEGDSDTVKEAATEIARLRALVEYAYHEGFKDGDFFTGTGTWKTSNSRTTLEQKP